MLFNRIGEDLILLRKGRADEERDIMSFVLSELKALAKNKNVETLSDEEVITSLKKQVKQREDTISTIIGYATDEKHLEAARKLRTEVSYIEGYLPEEVDIELATKIIQEAILSVDAKSMKDMGKVIAEVNRASPGIDKSLIAKVTKEFLDG
jgi:uncharacterized protein YqeY